MDITLHNPVMVNEVVDGLDCRPGKAMVDATLGSGGHSLAILGKIGEAGVLIAIDKDERAVTIARERLKDFENVHIYRLDWSELKSVLNLRVDGFLMDLGLASFQVDDSVRGFSYKLRGPLDMRFDQRDGLTAAGLLNSLSEKELTGILQEYGEEPYSKRIARSIAEERRRGTIDTTTHLAQIIRKTVKGNPKKSLVRCFQALRIAVNEELNKLREALDHGISILKPRGRICVISYHSLEDRIVKFAFRELSNSLLNVITRRPIVPSREEVINNSRARSAKLRIAERKNG